MGVYFWIEVQLITTPGIYHNANLGLISLSSDGTNWTTIADKNLGATTVYNSGDTLSEANCGKYYQWGNNYGFPFTGATTTSSTQVNAQNYGPGNYYSSSTYITKGWWDSSYNANLRGDTTNTNEARKGPCDNGYHIPSNTEFTNLINMGVDLGAWNTSSGDNMRDLLFIPYGGTRTTGGTAGSQGVYGYYWSSTAYSDDRAYCLEFYSTVNHIGNAQKGYGMEIRPFKNEAVQPDTSWTKLD